LCYFLCSKKVALAKRSYYDLMLYPLVTNGVKGAVVRIEDVTERTRIQELMVQTEKMISVGGLAAGMAHEINNPLGIIMQASQNLERRMSPDLPANIQAAKKAHVDMQAMKEYFEAREIHSFIRDIGEAASRAARIISNMLQFTRKNETVARQHVKLAEILDRTLELAASDYDLKKKFDFRNIEIVKEYGSDVSSVRAVAIELEQVFLNLLKNAAQAMDRNPEGRKPRIAIRTRNEDRYAVVEIEDNGSGMEDHVLRRVFEPFFTTKEPGVGTGLGLSVSYMIITQSHKGLISVESKAGEGTKFTVKLPAWGNDNLSA